MAQVIRESDVDVDAIREHVNPTDAAEALGKVAEVSFLLVNLDAHRPEGKRHELLRALAMIENALADALDGTHTH